MWAFRAGCPTMRSMSTPLPADLLEPLLSLAEGRADPEAWLAWWDENRERVEAAVSRGAFLRMRPLSDRTVGANYATAPSQPGVWKLLEQLQVSFTRSERYAAAAEEEFRAWSAAGQAREDARRREFLPILKRLEGDFPRFARFLRRRLDRIEQLEGGVPEEEAGQGASWPAAYRRWREGVRVLDLETLKFGEEHPFLVASAVADLPSQGMLCIADYALEADGDQVLLDPREGGDDPPVFYYAHGVPEVRRLAASFTAWIESLPKSPALRDD